MAYEPKPGDFTIFKNDYKTEDKHPDYKGKGLDLNGNPVDLALWIKEGQKGKFFSGRMSASMEKAAPRPAPSVEPDDGDLPF